MKVYKELQNHNKLYSETASEVFYPTQSSDFSIRMVLKGNEDYKIGQRSLSVFPGNFLILNEGTGFSRKISSHLPVNTFSVSFSSTFLQDFHHSYTSSHPHLLDDPFIDNKSETPKFLETLYPLTGDMNYNLLNLKKHFDSNSNNEILLNEYLHQSLKLYYKVYNKEIINKTGSLSFLSKQTKVEIIKRLTIAKDYIQSNFAQRIQLHDIGKQACLSVNHLLRTFKEAYGCSPHQYLMQVRLTQAKFLLKNTTYPVNEIVDLVGFECPSSFIRLFKNNFNITPGSFRNAKGAMLVN